MQTQEYRHKTKRDKKQTAMMTDSGGFDTDKRECLKLRLGYLKKIIKENNGKMPKSISNDHRELCYKLKRGAK